jgi:hypothetical protein
MVQPTRKEASCTLILCMLPLLTLSVVQTHIPYLHESNAHINFQNLGTKEVFAGECNAHRQKVHSLQQRVFITNSILQQKKNTIL